MKSSLRAPANKDSAYKSLKRRYKYDFDYALLIDNETNRSVKVTKDEIILDWELLEGGRQWATTSQTKNRMEEIIWERQERNKEQKH